LQVPDKVGGASIVLFFGVGDEGKGVEGGDQGQVFFVLIPADEVIEDGLAGGSVGVV
jgi:hypothetical protein